MDSRDAKIGPVHPLVVPPLVAVLFVRRDSVYKTMPGCDCYDEDRNARTWPGGCPVVAHPPCRTWGCLKAFASQAPEHEHGLGPWAVEQVRTWGGVLEHPKGSSLFRACECARPYENPDQWGGWTMEVDQFHWGHKARKRTWLYVVGTFDVPARPFRAGQPTHCIGRPGGPRKPGQIPCVTHEEREKSPPAFAAWLVEVALRCKGNNPGLSGGTPSAAADCSRR